MERGGARDIEVALDFEFGTKRGGGRGADDDSESGIGIDGKEVG